MVHSDRPKHAYLNPMPDSRIRPRRGFAAGGDGVWGNITVVLYCPTSDPSTAAPNSHEFLDLFFLPPSVCELDIPQSRTRVIAREIEETEHRGLYVLIHSV